MPRVPRRINVTLAPDVLAAVKEWASVTGLAGPQLVAMIMANSLPIIHAMTAAMRVVKSDPKRAMEIMGDIVDDVSVGVAQLQLGIGKERKKLRRSTKSKS